MQSNRDLLAMSTEPLWHMSFHPLSRISTLLDKTSVLTGQLGRTEFLYLQA